MWHGIFSDSPTKFSYLFGMGYWVFKNKFQDLYFRSNCSDTITIFFENHHIFRFRYHNVQTLLSDFSNAPARLPGSTITLFGHNTQIFRMRQVFDSATTLFGHSYQIFQMHLPDFLVQLPYCSETVIDFFEFECTHHVLRFSYHTSLPHFN